ncbi:hypothetical protein ACFW6Q_12125 [Streptomyces sp. NPDC058737]|uniref:hypothetical protein n=1 Tax=Streptomyces sp. NPDC058737 TaxID=3346617 RepID=UPI00367FE9B3
MVFAQQFAWDEEHSEPHLSMLADPDPGTAKTGERVETTPLDSPHFGTGLRCLRSWAAPEGHLMRSVGYAWNDPSTNIDLLLKSHYDDPALLEASFDVRRHRRLREARVAAKAVRGRGLTWVCGAGSLTRSRW